MRWVFWGIVLNECYEELINFHEKTLEVGKPGFEWKKRAVYPLLNSKTGFTHRERNLRGKVLENTPISQLSDPSPTYRDPLPVM